MNHYRDKVVVVTGAAHGLGKAICQCLVEYGATVISLDKDEDGLNKIVPENSKKRIKYCVDVSIFDDVENIKGQIESSFGVIDMLINNAGVSCSGTVLEMSPSQFKWVIDTNLVGTFNCTKSMLPLLIKRGNAQVVNISSGIAFHGLPGFSAYAASKAAIRSFSQSIRLETIDLPLSISTVYPGPIRTNMPERGLHAKDSYRVRQSAYLNQKGYPPEYVACKILLAVSRKKKEINIGWEVKLGYHFARFMPGIFEYLLCKFRDKLPGQKL